MNRRFIITKQSLLEAYSSTYSEDQILKMIDYIKTGYTFSQALEKVVRESSE
jgi:hypothetical protein